MAIGLLYDPLFLEHDTGHHPENAGRLVAVTRLLHERGYLDHLTRLQAAPASESALAEIHSTRYLRALEELAASGGGFANPDTVMSQASYTVARLAAGAAARAATAVVQGEVSQAFALVRPPGHHARPAQAMGFCLLNSVALAARAAQAVGAGRVLIVDFDVHHGNGTQEIFYQDPSVLFFSSHQFPAYPGTGALEEVGVGAGRGATVNVPLPAGVGDDGYRRVYRELLPAVARRFRPDLILVSAGYDAHWTNTRYLSSIRMGVTVRGFGHVVTELRTLAVELCRGRLALVLEGGYDPDALAWSVAATIDSLLDRPVEDPIGPSLDDSPEPDVEPVLEAVAQIHGLGTHN